MSSYESFARVYDLFMDNIPYEEWCGYLTGLLEDQGIRDGLVLELGCGTGNMTRLLAGKGYDMIGVDNSVDMLEIAMEKKEEEGQDILYLLQDMREFELYGTVRAVVSVCDSMNYITDEEGKTPVLSGIIIMILRNRSTNMIWLFLSRWIRMGRLFTGSMRRPIIRKPILWKR